MNGEFLRPSQKTLLAAMILAYVSGCTGPIENVRLQAAPYTNNIGQYRIPIWGDLNINMYPNDRIPIFWGDIEVLVVKFLEVHPKAYKSIFNRNEYVFLVEPANTTYQIELQEKLGLRAILDFEPTEIIVRQNYPETVFVEGIANRIKIKADESYEVKDGTRLMLLEIDFGEALRRMLLAMVDTVEETEDGFRLAWTRKEEIGISTYTKRKITKISLGVDINGSNDRVIVTIEDQLWRGGQFKEKTEQVEQFWPKTLRHVGHRPTENLNSDAISKATDPRKIATDPAKSGEVRYEIPEIAGHRAAVGTLWISDGQATLDLRKFADIATTELEVNIKFSVEDDVRIFRVERDVFVQINRND